MDFVDNLVEVSCLKVYDDSFDCQPTERAGRSSAYRFGVHTGVHSHSGQIAFPFAYFVAFGQYLRISLVAYIFSLLMSL